MHTPFDSEGQEIFSRSLAQRWGLPVDLFQAAFKSLLMRHLPVECTEAERRHFLEKLHLEDWVLAQACANGSVSAWEHFVHRFRTPLLGAARALVKDIEIARELADSLAGDLLPTNIAGVSKLASYSGRGSLENWLKALLANSYIDRYRIQRRTVSLEQRGDILRRLYVESNATTYSRELRLDHAIERAFQDCEPEAAFLLTAYFFDHWTLAELAIAVGVHQSSVSRRIDRVLRQLRRRIHQNLHECGIDRRQMEELFRTRSFETGVDLRRLLLSLQAGRNS